MTIIPKKLKHKFKRLFIDIETSPNIVSSWRIGYNINLSPDNIIKERAIICVSWKWEGYNKTFNVAWDKNQCDKGVLERIIPVLNAADEIVYQNGDRFDLPWMKTRALYHSIPMLPVYKTFDTFKKMKSNFYLNSMKLDYFQKFTQGKGKMETGGFKLWQEVALDNNRKSLKTMVNYCDVDVEELEEAFNKIIPYVPHNTHVGASLGLPKYTCAHCGSTDAKLTKTRYTASGTARRQLRCGSCHKYYTISNTDYKKLIKEVG
jgi:DNA polymerase elongation subunit (family B)